jgi:hypothetical protein
MCQRQERASGEMRGRYCCILYLEALGVVDDVPEEGVWQW